MQYNHPNLFYTLDLTDKIRQNRRIMKILILHGPNMNMLGVREPLLYGNTTLEQLNARLTAYGQKHDLQISTYQSNHEGMLIDMIQNSYQKIDHIVFNPAALTQQHCNTGCHAQ